MVNYPLESGLSAIDGHGVFAAAVITGRAKIGEVTGEIVTRRTARKRFRDSKKIYQVDVSDTHTLDCTQGNLLRLLNHSCQSNAYLRIFRNRVEVYAKRAIEPGEEITVDYGETPHGGGMHCTCEGKRCRKNI